MMLSSPDGVITAEPQEAPASSGIEMMSRLKVKVTSADRSVSVNYGARGSMAITLHNPQASRHTERTLETEIDKALDGMSAGFAKALERATPGGSLEPADPRTSISGMRAKIYNAQVGRIRVDVKSSAGHCRVCWQGSSGIRVKIKPNAINQIGIEQLSWEINDSLSKVLNELALQIGKAHKHAFADLSTREIERNLRERRFG